MKPLLEVRFGLAKTHRNQWFAAVPSGTAKEDILAPSFWAFISARRFHPLDEIIVVDDDMTYRLHLLVTDAWHNGAKVQILSEVTLTPAAEDKHESGLRAAWKGPHFRWSLVNKDGAIVRSGFPDKQAALADLVNQAATARVENL